MTVVQLIEQIKVGGIQYVDGDVTFQVVSVEPGSNMVQFTRRVYSGVEYKEETDIDDVMRTVLKIGLASQWEVANWD